MLGAEFMSPLLGISINNHALNAAPQVGVGAARANGAVSTNITASALRAWFLFRSCTMCNVPVCLVCALYFVPTLVPLGFSCAFFVWSDLDSFSPLRCCRVFTFSLLFYLYYHRLFLDSPVIQQTTHFDSTRYSRDCMHPKLGQEANWLAMQLGDTVVHGVSPHMAWRDLLEWNRSTTDRFNSKQRTYPRPLSGDLLNIYSVQYACSHISSLERCRRNSGRGIFSVAKAEPAQPRLLLQIFHFAIVLFFFSSHTYTYAVPVCALRLSSLLLFP